MSKCSFISWVIMFLQVWWWDSTEESVLNAVLRNSSEKLWRMFFDEEELRELFSVQHQWIAEAEIEVEICSTEFYIRVMSTEVYEICLSIEVICWNIFFLNIAKLQNWLLSSHSSSLISALSVFSHINSKPSLSSSVFLCVRGLTNLSFLNTLISVNWSTCVCWGHK